MFGWIESVRSFFFGPQSLEEIEKSYLDKLIKTNTKYPDNVCGLMESVTKQGFKDIEDDLPPSDLMVGMFDALPWINFKYPQLFESGGYYEKLTGDLHRLFGWGRLIRIPNVAFNPSAMGWIVAQDKFIKQVNGEPCTLESEKAQAFIDYLIKNAKNGIE